MWVYHYPRFHMALWTAIALCWLILGVNSDAVPWGGGGHGWLVGCALVAGSALGVAYRSTRDSMLTYLVFALIAGSIRSLSYLIDGATGPGWVWLIVGLTNVVLLGHWGNTQSERRG